MSWASKYSTRSLRRQLIRHMRKAWWYEYTEFKAITRDERENAATIKTELTRRGEWTP